MTLVGLDDTDSRERGMCTTYVASRIASRLRDHGSVTRLLLIRLNPAVEYKTRGNAAISIHTDVDPLRALDVARTALDGMAITDDDRTNPGLVVADRPVSPPSGSTETATVDPAVTSFTHRAIREQLAIEDASDRIADAGYDSHAWGNGRGLIGALAAIGAWDALDEWTVEHIAYREPERWGTARNVAPEPLREAAQRAYPDVWDTVDRGTGELVAIPRTPGPVLAGIRGDDAETVDGVVERLDGEPIATSQRFLTNQGTDVHLKAGKLGALTNGHAYVVDGTVATEPDTRRGGHVFVSITDAPNGSADAGGEGTRIVQECVAFEPTKRFRDHVRNLGPGDRITACGEVSRETLKLEKFAVRGLRRDELVTPSCPSCDRTMESAGRGQGYRCRDCGTTAESRTKIPVDRDLELGWYEVPPRARRHIAKPLVRGGFDAPTHPER